MPSERQRCTGPDQLAVVVEIAGCVTHSEVEPSRASHLAWEVLPAADQDAQPRLNLTLDGVDKEDIRKAVSTTPVRDGWLKFGRPGRRPDKELPFGPNIGLNHFLSAWY
jgi:hypothetical protein